MPHTAHRPSPALSACFRPTETGDLPDYELPAEVAKELKAAHKGKVFEMDAKPFWDYDRSSGKWGWARAAPAPAVKAQKAPADPLKAAKQKVGCCGCAACTVLLLALPVLL